MSAAQPLLSAAVRQLTRSAYGVVVAPVRGFQVFRIDGYSWTKTLPPGECIMSSPFTVGGRNWQIDYYPNGMDAGKEEDSDAISLYLRLSHGGGFLKERVRAQYKFSLLDATGAAAYELPPETSVFTSPGRQGYGYGHDGDEVVDDVGFGLRDFVTKEELERRAESLLKDDCLAVRCDVGVTEKGVVAVAPKENYTRHDDGDDYSDWEGGGRESSRRRRPLDDKEYVRRTLAKNRRA